ncbi:Flagellar motor switch protein FliN [Acidisarcina polymorpha]|uniref:Flagellar motor switch protein FliN n=1 Tax=Acidisarcina polymorpha TaxID=2211140 RepID=A0A2Z5FS11_9BACT|nr:Flagellar motor switch protein FliN [Acidisarcina polymorpha]
MSMFIASWLKVAAEVLEAEFSQSFNLLPGAAIPPGASTMTLMVDLAGDWSGTFTVTADETALATLFAQLEKKDGSETRREPLNPEEVREEWQRIFRKTCVEAAAAFGRSTGKACEVAMISPESVPVGSEGMGYQLRAGKAKVALVVADLVAAEPARVEPPPAFAASSFQPLSAVPEANASPRGTEVVGPRDEMPGIDLLRDVELEASLRFGSREMALSDLLALGPGDVIQLNRAISDAVDLIIGDKIVARGEVVLVNGNFGLQVTEVAEPRKSLESIRCLF